MAASLPPSELSSHLGYWLRSVSNHVSQAFAAKVAVKGVTVAEWVILRSLHGKEPMPPSRLADDMGMTRGAITKLADRLIAKALIVREASVNDGRAQTLALTPQGTSLVPELAALADQNDAEFFDFLSADERRSLERLLKRIAEHRQMTTIPVE
ncbi:MarR family transcriptional regulator [Kaistia algarum]|uniref:MarR family winged helix-turn-helix transcriptional regulator n=1 Tax=Kaistia algarum TaxID=2083279 RepID=UPI000CE91612|nr:MarR family transcriptional regulator [Kaistia algarum]MCX5516496.1 MarR family transcriptional regulator [Kaistia algarum]PPE78388.1 MarR family transcriptional regulator [Kaistia algarum]